VIETGLQPPLPRPGDERKFRLLAAAALLPEGAITLTLGVATYGLLADRRGVALVAVAASLAIAVAIAVRARSSLHERVELDRANASLQQTNAGLRAVNVAVTEGFNLIDDRTQGRLRELVEQTGDDLAAIVAERLD
jgi:hypothetical protein